MTGFGYELTGNDTFDDTAWYVDASCAETDPELWFPEQSIGAATARSICRGCAVIEECLDFALRHDIDHGVWGGLTARERRKLHRTRETK
ncbi:WhiB family transcriptional regulator [Microbacterium sp. CJ88]|uniref:WhiB family transcriptional regulator n=1 Tax=Microbacterium sp. CJ88 TaxID=3445672 RepID=UPI003F656E60